MVVQIFQGILQGNDMILLGGIDPVYQAGQSGGFSASGRSGDENHALGVFRKPHDCTGNAKRCRIGQFKGDDTDDGGQRATLLVGAYPETGKTGDRKGKIVIAVFQKIINGMRVREFIDLTDKSLRAVGHQSLSLMKKYTVDPVGKRKAGNDKNIRSPGFRGILKDGCGVYGRFIHR